MPKMKQLGERIWVIDAPLSTGAIALGSRSTVVKLADGGLAVISPVALDGTSKKYIDALGPVRAIVAPNSFHHLYLEPWRFAFPDAKTYVSPALAAKKPGLHRDGLLGDEAPALYRDDLRQVFLAGVPRLSEYVFFHPASRTLIQTDSAFHIRNSPKFATRLLMRLNGGYDRYGPTRYFRWMVKDRKALGKSLRRVLEWDFDRIVVAHGDVVPAGGKIEVRRAYGTYLKGA